MAGNLWSIMIVSGSPYASFVPDVYCPPGQTPPTALQAQVGDNVSWNNQTGQEHEIWQTGGDRITQQIDPGRSSQPAFIVGGTAPTIVEYYCSIHPDEKGTINVIV